jgi:tetratricopeptide (TPR) repeat protein
MQQAMEIYRAVEDKFGIRGILAHLGHIALLSGNDGQAREYFDERLAIERELISKASIASALCDLGIAVGHLGDIAHSTKLFNDGLELSQEIGDTYLIAVCLTGLASIHQQPDRAAQMLATAQAAFERSGKFIEPIYRVEHERAENKIREVLGAQDFARFSEEGHTMTIEQAIIIALKPAEEM